MIAGSKLWHFVVDDSHTATALLMRQKRLRLPGEMHFLCISELLSDPGKKAVVDGAWIAQQAPRYRKEAIPALDLIEKNTEGVQVGFGMS